ncbi:hypothetical protein RJ53_07485 [Methanocalculus chunghsingensis]|uniref:Uncharacterized protein n=1 Tax=Methanocalculus chunghsingensis TaxID=156457 RepID=A0A8J8B5Q6_9EURY|nr:DUF5320 domain-containing protein [Methanocalculus chunghsingensis]MBR1369343.1 hypothetical protein [Methanocalculus chunghsingensis]
MPGLNGRGPLGMGPMTGRRMGRCVSPSSDAQSAAQSEQIIYGLGRGGLPCGCGRGFGGGRMRGRFVQINTQNEVQE